MKPLALIIRPFCSAEKTARQLEAIGINSFTEPLLEIVKRDDAKNKVSAAIVRNVQAIIVTSENAVFALKGVAKEYSGLPVLAVGKATARALEELGFSNVCESKSGDVSGIINLVKEKYQPGNGGFLYVSANITTVNLPQKLGEAGFSVEQVIVYDAIAMDDFSDECVAMLKSGAFDMVLFFSTRTAEIFCSIVKKRNLEDCLRDVRAICISQKVAAPLAGMSFKNIVTQLPVRDIYIAK